MSLESSFLDLEEQSFEVLKSNICAVVSQLDEAVGRPPFPNPSTLQCRSLARSLVCMLHKTHQKGCIAALAACREINMTFPVLCASLTSGSEGGKPCLILMELLLEALVFVHSVSLYPLQSTLKDAKEVLSISPVTLKLFVLTGFINVDTLSFFLGINTSSKVEKNALNSSKVKNGSAIVAVKQKHKTAKVKIDVTSERDVSVVKKDMLNTALELALPADCVKFLLSLFDSHNKFQRIVGNDSELAAKVINVYGDHILSHLRPLSLLHCIDVFLLDSFVTVVRMQKEAMILVKGPVITEISLNKWSFKKLSSLIGYCCERQVRQEEVFASFLVYIFFSKLLEAWEISNLTQFPIKEEAMLWIAVLRVAHMLSLSSEGLLPTADEERFFKPFDMLVESIMRRHTINAVRAVVPTVSHDSVIATLELMAVLLNAKLKLVSCAAATTMSRDVAGGGGRGGCSGKKKVRTRNLSAENPGKHAETFGRAEVINQYFRWIANSCSFLFCLIPPDAVELPVSCSPWHIVEMVAALFFHFTDGGTRAVFHKTTWESFLNLIITIATMRMENDDALIMGQKTMVMILTAVSVTHQLEVVALIASRGMPEVCAQGHWPLSAYKTILDAWLSKKTCANTFYAPVFLLSPTESVGTVLDFLDASRLNELAQLLLNTGKTAAALLSVLEEVLLQERVGNGAENEENNEAMAAQKSLRGGVNGFLRLRQALVDCMDKELKKTVEKKQKEEEIKTRKYMEEVLKTEELMEKTIAFKKDAEKRQCAKNEELMHIQLLMEQRQREKEERRVREREKIRERRKMAVMALQEMDSKTKEERLIEQRERLLQYRKRVVALLRTSSFFESLGLSSFKIMRLMSDLRPYLVNMTLDDLLEYVVTGNIGVPKDMHAVDDNCFNDNFADKPLKGEKKEGCFGEERFSFWDSVMQITAQLVGEGARDSHEVSAEEINADVPYLSFPAVATSATDVGGGDSPSFHRRISVVLNLFNFLMGANDTLPDKMPLVSVRAASRLLDGKETLKKSNFCNVVEVLNVCQQRGLCVLQEDVCKLTPLGFRYHYPFHDPSLSLDIQLELRRRKVQKMMAEQQEDTECASEEQTVRFLDTSSSLSNDSSVVFFGDELF